MSKNPVKHEAAVDVKSLVSTAISWINLEFPNPDEGVEEQTVKEIKNELEKSMTALDNLIACLK